MGLKGACPSVSSQAEVKKLATDLPSQPAVVKYVNAYVISKKMGKMPKIPRTKGNKWQQRIWKTRIEDQIKSMRAELSIRTDMTQKGETQKICKKKTKN